LKEQIDEFKNDFEVTPQSSIVMGAATLYNGIVNKIAAI
jgi:hypothetical protein